MSSGCAQTCSNHSMGCARCCCRCRGESHSQRSHRHLTLCRMVNLRLQSRNEPKFAPSKGRWWQLRRDWAACMASNESANSGVRGCHHSTSRPFAARHNTFARACTCPEVCPSIFRHRPDSVSHSTPHLRKELWINPNIGSAARATRPKEGPGNALAEERCRLEP